MNECQPQRMIYLFRWSVILKSRKGDIKGTMEPHIREALTEQYGALQDAYCTDCDQVSGWKDKNDLFCAGCQEDYDSQTAALRNRKNKAISYRKKLANEYKCNGRREVNFKPSITSFKHTVQVPIEQLDGGTGRTMYFILDPLSNKIKIGIAGNVAGRFSSIQTGCPQKLVLLGTRFENKACERLEAALHEKFQSTHFRGEWYHSSQELLEFITDSSVKLGNEFTVLMNPENKY
jgi:hypothetical protein